MKSMLRAIVVAFCLAFALAVTAQGVLPSGDDRKGGPVNAWGSDTAFLKFVQVTLPAFIKALDGMTYEQLEAVRTVVLSDAAQASAGSAAYTEATMKEAAIRSAMYRLKSNPAPGNRPTR